MPILLNDGMVWWAAGASCAVDLRSQWIEGLRVVWVGGRGSKQRNIRCKAHFHHARCTSGLHGFEVMG